MTRKLALVALVILCATAAVPLFVYYDIRYNRPIDIQRELLGRVVALRSQQVDFDWHMTGYGDALFKWSYRVAHPEELRRSCRTIDRGNCILGGHSGNDGSQSIYVTGDTLKIEEWWY
jgi:hypothetical protein